RTIPKTSSGLIRLSPATRPHRLSRTLVARLSGRRDPERRSYLPGKFHTSRAVAEPLVSNMTQLLLFNITNGLIIGAFYVLMALGLSLILNLSNVINFAHGGFLVVGGYIAYTITPYVGFWGALLIAPPLVAIIGLAIERTLIRPLYGRDPLYSLLLTFGLAFMIEDGTRFIWGPQGKPVNVPAVLAQPLSNEFFFVTAYRLFMVVVVVVAVALLFVLLRYTRLSMRIRAGTLDLETVSALGINVGRLRALNFAVGIFLAGLSG